MFSLKSSFAFVGLEYSYNWPTQYENSEPTLLAAEVLIGKACV